MTQPRTTQELFDSAGSGAPLFFNKNSPVGASVTGTVVESAPTQARDYEDSSLKFWDDGSPQMQLVITLQTNERDPWDAEDDGKRRVYVKWWGSEKANLIAAVQKAGDKFVQNGARLTVTFTGLGEQKDRKLNPPKLYDFQYQAPPSATEQLMTKPPNGLVEQARATQQAVPQAAPAAPATNGAGPTDRQAIIRQVRELGAEGFEPSDIFEVIGGAFSQKAIAAMLNVKA